MLEIDISSITLQQDEPMPSACNKAPGIPAVASCTEWMYAMRRNMQEIVPGLFLGPYASAQKHSLSTLRDHGITHIVCVRQDVEANYIKPQINDPSITYLTLDIADTATENIIRFFPKVRQFIDDALLRNGKVLVHGMNGTSRSATLIVAYLMEKYGLSSKEAFEYVKKRRACIHPNEGFIAQLIEYEPIYRARQTLEMGGETSSSSHHENNNNNNNNNNKRQKRKSEHLTESIEYDPVQPPPSPSSDLSETTTNEVQPASDFSNRLYSLWLIKKSQRQTLH